MAFRWTPAAPALVARAASAANAAADDDAKAVAGADLAAGARAAAAYTAAGTDLLAARAVEPRSSPGRGALKDRAAQYADRAAALQAWLAAGRSGAAPPAWPAAGGRGCPGGGCGGGTCGGGGGGCACGGGGGGGRTSAPCSCGGGRAPAPCSCGDGRAPAPCSCAGGPAATPCSCAGGAAATPCSCGACGGTSRSRRDTGAAPTVATCPCDECRAERRRPRGVPEGGGMPAWLRRPVRDWVPPAADAGRVKIRCRRAVDENGRERVMFQLQGGYDVPGRYQ